MASAKRVFLSHGIKDSTFARRLAELISDRGVDVFIGSDVLGGDAWSEVLRREIEKVSALVLLLPSDTLSTRNYIWFEAGAAKALGKRVLAVRPPGQRSGEVPPNVADVLILDADQRTVDEIADTLFHAIPDLTEEPIQAVG